MEKHLERTIHQGSMGWTADEDVDAPWNIVHGAAGELHEGEPRVPYCTMPDVIQFLDDSIPKNMVELCSSTA